MKIQFWSVGKAHEPFVQAGIELYTQRIRHYFPAEWLLIAPPKNNMSEALQKQKEGESILQLLKDGDVLIALDEKGKMLSSEGLSQHMQQRADSGTKRLIFLIGGAWGLEKGVLQKAQFVWSLSALTFPHQLVRLILAEQVYRACTILRNEKYHHR